VKVIPQGVRKQLAAKMARWRQLIARELSDDTVAGLSEGNEVRVFFAGDNAYEAMLTAIANARHFVHLEMYMFLSDQIGQTFAAALSKKAREGIPVRVIYDAIGSFDTDVMQWANMRDAGVKVAEYHPVGIWRKHAGIPGRNHRKNLITDGTTGFTGGMNIGNPWSQEQQQENAWRDTQISVRGPAAAELNQLFLDSWKHATKETLPHIDITPPPCGTSRCMVVGSQGLGSRKQIRQLFSVHLDQARHSVKMTMPYFVPPRRLRKSMQHAAERGVDIAVLVPRDSDVTIVDWLREGLYPKLLRWRVRVIEYLGPVLHAKTMVVDDNIAIIGSNNFDILSVLMNRETALIVFDDEVAEELNRQWENDLMLSERVASDWKGIRPWWRLMMAKAGCFLIRKL
jgi:cardiolipin synthase